jgi:nucleoside-diphosphate-sugar epimerase
VPPPEAGARDTRIRRLLEKLRGEAAPRRIVYVSTTGVYGDTAGDWVDERSPVDPSASRAVRRLDAEQALRDWGSQGAEQVILRVPGIYGPGRLPIERIRQGLPLVRPEEAPYTNRIHVDDLVSACVAAMERGRAGEVYNAADGHPSSMADYFCRIADLAGLPRPPLLGLAEAKGVLSPGMLSYLRESRRVSNRKLLETLGVQLRYPTLESGLRACFAEERGL